MLASAFGKEAWEELTTHEKRSASGYGGAAHRQGKTIDQAWVNEHSETPPSHKKK